MKKVLVTGGAGYIGSVMVPMLLSKGYKVTVIDDFIFNQSSLLDVIHNKNLTVIKDDVRNYNLLKNQVSKHDIIIPLAAVVGAPACKKDVIYSTQLNFEQIKNISNLSSKDQKIIFPVTNSGYGIGQKGVYCDENTPLNPISHYGKTKVDAEKVLLDFGNAVTLRLATVFGSSTRMRTDLLVNDFVYRACKDNFIVLFESHFKRNYIHIRDVSNAFIHSIDNFDKMKGEPYNLGLSEANLSKMELCLKIKEKIKNFNILEAPLAEDPDKRDYIVSNKKIENTGWKPLYTIENGIEELIKLYSFLKVNNYNNV
tara:strand:- start:245 stop:1180 length:936 start_codon:yes stop_codon:yes gene_type:complete